MGACCVSTKNSSNDIKKEGQIENEENEKLEVVKSKKMNDNPKKENGEIRQLPKESKPVIVESEVKVTEKDKRIEKESPDIRIESNAKDVVIDKGARSEKYKEKAYQSEANNNDDLNNQHEMKIINYTNANRSAPNDSYYDNKDHQENVDDMVENYANEEDLRENKRIIVDKLDNIDDEVIIIQKDESVNVEKKDNEIQSNNHMVIDLHPQEVMSDFEDVTKGQNVVVMKNSKPKSRTEAGR